MNTTLRDVLDAIEDDLGMDDIQDLVLTPEEVADITAAILLAAEGRGGL